MSGRKRGRGAEQGPAPLTPDERDEAERALVDAFRDQIDRLIRKSREIDGKRAELERARTDFELREQLDHRVGLELYAVVAGRAHGAVAGALDGTVSREAYEQLRRTEDLVGRYLREAGNPFLAHDPQGGRNV